jgi:hypothetical protein
MLSSARSAESRVAEASISRRVAKRLIKARVIQDDVGGACVGNVQRS